MLIFLGVENFAKIEEAKVCINSYTLLVGPNNSGKTYLMQLVQGVNEKLASLVDEEGLRILKHEKSLVSDMDDDKNESYADYMISQDNILQFVSYLNEKLDERKAQIVKEIYGREIPVGKLYVEIFLETGEKYRFILSNNKNKINIVLRPVRSSSSILENTVISAVESLNDTLDDFKVCLVEKCSAKGKEEIKSLSFRPISESVNEDIVLVKSALRDILDYRSLFLPASRAGIMLLYRDFFANKADDMFSYQIKENHLVDNKNYGELTWPVYQFLRFLQTYSEKEDNKRNYRKEIEFFEEKLIEGHISTNKQNGFSYDSVTDNVRVPMYMASSMINEIAPFVLALTGGNFYGRFIIDEIEASLHPQKQLELVRFLNRLSNKGVKLILSTHSDTFASKINNLYILSNYLNQDNGDDAIKKMGLEKEDLMSPDRLFVYEFVNQSNGKSVVKEIPGDRKTGFQFDLFTDSAMHLYNEALEIGEILQNDQTQP